MTQEQLHHFVRFCDVPLFGCLSAHRHQALRLVYDHLERRTPARWLPDILYAHGLPRYAKALDEILSL
jgi:hypothetical protein